MLTGIINLRKKIVVLESDQLINAGVLSFLAAQDSFDVTGLESSDPEQVYREIESFQPDVVIIDQSSQSISVSQLMAHFENIPHIRTIVLSVDNNQIQICDKRQIQIEKLSDFIAVL